MSGEKNQVLENMKTRRSIRKYKPDMVPKEIIEKIAEAGTYAATGMGKQSPIIIAVTNKDNPRQLATILYEFISGQTYPAQTQGGAE